MNCLPYDLPNRLAQRLSRADLPGGRVQRRMAPDMAMGRHRGPVSPGVHRAAVCICLVWHSDDWWLPLTLRAHQVADHANQVSLPGGRLEGNEGPAAAARREFQEELGCSLDAAERLGQLSSLYVFGSHHHVDVFVHAIHDRPTFRPNPDEVAEVLWMPVRDLLDADQEVIATMQRGTSKFDAPGFRCQNHVIWGATAMILAEFAEIVRQCLVEEKVAS
jgi:8-oxo-dGTP pyrophosphatase MutT (NUDIX family)